MDQRQTMKTESEWRGGVLLVDKPSGPSSFDVVREFGDI